MKTAIKKGLKQVEAVEGRGKADTIRLWESYRDQALLWRAIAILQVPATILALTAALIMFFYADTIVEVPPQPKPGRYSANQLPDSEFIHVAEEVTNLIATYQPSNARRQFEAAQMYLWEPALSEFENKVLKDELRAIEETGRSQIFFVNDKQIRIDRDEKQGRVMVRLPGSRMKLIRNQPLPGDEMVYYIKMSTIPRNAYNEYGIVVYDIRLRKASEKVIAKEDLMEQRDLAIAEKKAAKK